MEVLLEPGKYVAAVSGGVDSMVLLNLLSRMQNVEIIVAHFDHGIRPDSNLDRQLVEDTVRKLGMKFEYHEGKLGAGASEATGRQARYDFLKAIKQKHGATAIVTAHHRDDVLETVIINMTRGTGRRGLTSLKNTPEIRRPLLKMHKAELLAYARDSKLEWHEDTTNDDQKILRNYIRQSVIPKIKKTDKELLFSYVDRLAALNDELDEALDDALLNIANKTNLDRHAVETLPFSIIKELLTAWWRSNGFFGYESKTLQRALHDIRACQTGAIVPLKQPYYMTIGRQELALHKHER